MMPTQRVLSDNRRAREALSRDVGQRASLVRARFKSRDMGLDEKLSPHEALRGHEPLRKMPPPDRRYWPSQNSQRAPRRPQARKGSAR